MRAPVISLLLAPGAAGAWSSACGRAAPRRTSRVVACEPQLPWKEKELWALEDAVPHYSLDSGNLVLWRRMGLDVPELLNRTPDELRARWFALDGVPEDARADNPPCLENWECVGERRYEGDLCGMGGVRDGSLRVVVEASKEGATDAAEHRCVRTSVGDVFQLGLPRPDESAEPGTLPWAWSEGGIDGVVEAARARGGDTRAAIVRSPAVRMAGGALLAAAAAGGAFALSGHHVDVSVFIV